MLWRASCGKKERVRETEEERDFICSVVSVAIFELAYYHMQWVSLKMSDWPCTIAPMMGGDGRAQKVKVKWLHGKCTSCTAVSCQNFLPFKSQNSGVPQVLQLPWCTVWLLWFLPKQSFSKLDSKWCRHDQYRLTGCCWTRIKTEWT